MKEEEAKTEAQKRIDARSKVFCPLIFKLCRIDCECYTNPEIYNLDQNMPEGYYVRYGYCSAHCLNGGE